MAQAVLRIPTLREDAVERAQGKLPGSIEAKNLGGFKVRRNAESIPAHVNRLINVGSRPLQPRGIHLLLSRFQSRAHGLQRKIQPFTDFLERSADIENILRRNVVHFANFIDVITQTGDFRLFFSQDGFGFFQRPRKVVAIVVHRIIGILRGIEPAVFTIRKPFIHPANDVARNLGKKFRAGHLISVHIVLQQLGVVIAHLLEVRHDPALVYGVSMKSAGKLVVDSSVRHLL